MKISLFSGPGTRRWPRFRLSDIPSIGGVRSVAGFRIGVVDISRGGALLRTRRCLVPGTSIRLHIVTKEGNFPVAGFVLRSSDLNSKEDLPCRTAVSFDHLIRIPDHRPHEAVKMFQDAVRNTGEDTGMIADFLAIDFQIERDAAMAEMLRFNDW